MKKLAFIAYLGMSILTSGLVNAGTKYRRLKFRPIVNSLILINVFESPNARDNATNVLVNVIKQVESNCRVSFYNDQNSTWDGGANNFWSQIIADCPSDSANYLKANIHLKADDLKFLRRDPRLQKFTLVNIHSNAGVFDVEVNNRNADQDDPETVVISKKNYKYVPSELRGQPITVETLEQLKESYERSQEN